MWNLVTSFLEASLPLQAPVRLGHQDKTKIAFVPQQAKNVELDIYWAYLFTADQILGVLDRAKSVCYGSLSPSLEEGKEEQ